MKQQIVYTEDETKPFQFTFNKHIVLDDFTTVPFGFIEKLDFWHYDPFSTSIYDDNCGSKSIQGDILHLLGDSTY